MNSNLDSQNTYWLRNKRLVIGCLIVWFFVSLGCSVIFADYLNQFVYRGIPFGFWIAQQGSIITFVLIIFFYAWRMQKLDKALKNGNQHGS